jgi:hypothetical protein
LDEYEAATAALAKGWLSTRMKARKKWGERYAWAVRDQMTPIIETLDRLNLADAHKGREWEWRAVDDVSGVQFVYRIEVLY